MPQQKYSETLEAMEEYIWVVSHEKKARSANKGFLGKGIILKDHVFLGQMGRESVGGLFRLNSNTQEKQDK